MKLELSDDELTLRLEGMERLWAFKVSPIVIPRAHVVGVDTNLPPSTWRQIRAPGTSLPGVIKAGTYYTDRGKELWYVTRGQKDEPLTIELHGERYRRLVLTIDDSRSWAERIRAWMSP